MLLYCYINDNEIHTISFHSYSFSFLCDTIAHSALSMAEVVPVYVQVAASFGGIKVVYVGLLLQRNIGWIINPVPPFLLV